MRLGAHISIAGGAYKAFERARDETCDSMLIFTKSNRQWAAKPLADDDIARFQAIDDLDLVGGFDPGFDRHAALALAFASSSVAQAAEKKDMGLYVNLATKDTSKPAMHSPMRSSSTSAVTRWLSS